jgi:hypothetical protein
MKLPDSFIFSDYTYRDRDLSYAASVTAVSFFISIPKKNQGEIP